MFVPNGLKLCANVLNIVQTSWMGYKLPEWARAFRTLNRLKFSGSHAVLSPFWRMWWELVRRSCVWEQMPVLPCGVIVNWSCWNSTYVILLTRIVTPVVTGVTIRVFCHLSLPVVTNSRKSTHHVFSRQELFSSSTPSRQYASCVELSRPIFIIHQSNRGIVKSPGSWQN